MEFFINFIIIFAIVYMFDIALVGSVVLFVKEMVFQLLFGFLLFVPIILISFWLLGKYYQNQCQKREEEVDVIEMEEQGFKRKPIMKEKKKHLKGERRNG